MGWVDPWVGLGWVRRNGPMDNSDVSNRTTSRDTSRKTFHVPAATDDHARPEQEEFFSLRVAETVEPIETTFGDAVRNSLPGHNEQYRLFRAILVHPAQWTFLSTVRYINLHTRSLATTPYRSPRSSFPVGRIGSLAKTAEPIEMWSEMTTPRGRQHFVWLTQLSETATPDPVRHTGEPRQSG